MRVCAPHVAARLGTAGICCLRCLRFFENAVFYRDSIKIIPVTSSIAYRARHAPPIATSAHCA